MAAGFGGSAEMRRRALGPLTRSPPPPPSGPPLLSVGVWVFFFSSYHFRTFSMAAITRLMSSLARLRVSARTERPDMAAVVYEGGGGGEEDGEYPPVTCLSFFSASPHTYGRAQPTPRMRSAPPAAASARVLRGDGGSRALHTHHSIHYSSEYRGDTPQSDLWATWIP